MKPHTPPILSGLPFLLVPVPPTSADVLLDQMDMVRNQRYSTANGNAIGGDNLFGDGKQLALQIANDFRTTPMGYIITRVEVANLVFYRTEDITDVRVSIYGDFDGVPEETPVYSQRFSAVDRFSPAVAPGIRNIDFDDGYFGLLGVWTIVSGLHIVLQPETTYFVCVQVDTGENDWGYTIRNEDEVYGADSFGRDGPPEEDECLCGWRSEHWQSFGDALGRRGDAAYRVVATAESPPVPRPGLEKSVEPAEADQAGPAPRPPAHHGRHKRNTDRSPVSLPAELD